jgi:hypothetical protein
MSNAIQFERLRDRIIQIKGESVMLDADVAELYGARTRDINKSVVNNPGKFPAGYVIELSLDEKRELVENFHRFSRLKHSVVPQGLFPASVYLY